MFDEVQMLKDSIAWQIKIPIPSYFKILLSNFFKKVLFKPYPRFNTNSRLSKYSIGRSESSIFRK